MNQFVFATVVVLAVLWLVQLLAVLIYGSRFRRTGPIRPDHRPKFAIFMPLRGADPSLPGAIKSVVSQDYPCFELRVVIDSEKDPAWKVVHDVVGELGAGDKVKISALRQRRPTCSLLNNKLLQFLEELKSDDQLIAFADGDMVAPKYWLSRMADAMADPKVGGTLGNRWYVPPEGRWGSIVRYLWNAGAVVPMWMFDIPWSGGLSMRIEDMRRSGLVDRFRVALVEDSLAKAAIRSLGLRMQFIPELMIPNREETDLGPCYNFIKRQMLWTKLYHPFWFGVVFYAIWSSAVMFGPGVMAVIALVLGDWKSAGLLATAGVMYVAGLVCLVGLLEVPIGAMLRKQGQEPAKFSLRRAIQLFVGIPLSQAVYLATTLQCMRVRRVTWRGVTYEIEGPWDVKVVECAEVWAEQESRGNLSL